MPTLATMQAMVLKQPRAPLQLQHVPVPQPAAKQVQVRVLANRATCGIPWLSGSCVIVVTVAQAMKISAIKRFTQVTNVTAVSLNMQSRMRTIVLH